MTPLCVMKFDEERKQVVLDSLLPGVTLEEVVENTGFDLDVAGRQIPVMEPLTEE